MRQMILRLVVIMGAALCGAGPAFAATGLDGASLGSLWAVPFLGLLLSIALGPLLAPHLWEHHYGKITAGWAVLTLLPLALAYGPFSAFEFAMHALLHEYMSFIILLFALFVVAGGILVRGNIHGSALTNTGLLAIGAVLASFVGTTGASMILIRPMIRANDARRHNVHVVVFFILIVSNVGGALTPLGDPPLFVGFLRGVDFFWTTTNLFTEFLFVLLLLLAIFFVMDSWFWRKEDEVLRSDPSPDSRVQLLGLVNLPLLAVIIGAILLSASWKPGIVIDLPGGGIALQNLIRDVILLATAGVSLLLTPKALRTENGFNWHPIQEVAKLFAGIFLCMIPVLAMLKAGVNGSFAPLIALITTEGGAPDPFAYFWSTGILSAFLDNAPTYLVFFELAGGDPQQLMGPLARTLAAISTGAVFMGAMTYIGNAPNFMVYAIARNMRVPMPSFFGFLGWSCCILLPVLIAASFLFF